MAHAIELDDQIAIGLVFEEAYFSGVDISIITSEVKTVPIIYLAENESVWNVKARVNFFWQVIDKNIKK